MIVMYLKDGAQMTFAQHNERTAFLNMGELETVLHPDDSRRLWQLLDAHFHNEENTKEAAASTQTALDTDTAWTTDEGFVADHV